MANVGDLTQLYLEDGNCAICNKPTLRAGMEKIDQARGNKEPFICADCLVDLHRASHTKLTILQRITHLEARAERIEGKIDNMVSRQSRSLDFAYLFLGVLLGALLGYFLPQLVG